jgi:hypothetical protein
MKGLARKCGAFSFAGSSDCASGQNGDGANAAPYVKGMTVPGASETIRAAVAAWPGAGEAPHRFGGVEFTLGAREIGHLHGDRLLDVPFPRAVHDELIGTRQAEPHHVLPASGWISFRIKSPEDVERAVTLLRRSFDLITGQIARRAGKSRQAKGGRAPAARNSPAKSAGTS